MDFDRVVRTFLKENPGLKAKYLVEYVQKKTGLGRSAIFDRLSSMDVRGDLYRDKGQYWLSKPEDSLPERVDISRVSIEKSQVLLVGGRSLTIVVTLRNQSTASTTIEQTKINGNGERLIEQIPMVDIPPGATRQILIYTTADQIGGIWTEGGQVRLEIVHTHGVTIEDFEVPPLSDKTLPLILFSQE